jgi:hypothetical protein
VRIKRNEGVLIANPARIVQRRHVALLLADVGPNLVNLDPAAWKLAHLLVHPCPLRLSLIRFRRWSISLINSSMAQPAL